MIKLYPQVYKGEHFQFRGGLFRKTAEGHLWVEGEQEGSYEITDTTKVLVVNPIGWRPREWEGIEYA
jgi:hypothetical protein